MKKILVLMSLILVLAMSGTALAEAIGGHGTPIVPDEPATPGTPAIYVTPIFINLNITNTMIINAIQQTIGTNLGSITGAVSQTNIATSSGISTYLENEFSDPNTTYTLHSVILPVLQAFLTSLGGATFTAAPVAVAADTPPQFAIEISADVLSKDLATGSSVNKNNLTLLLKNKTGAAKTFTEMPDDSWRLLTSKGEPVNTVVASENYYIVLKLEEGKDYDFDTANTSDGKVEVAPVLVNAEGTPAPKHVEHLMENKI